MRYEIYVKVELTDTLEICVTQRTENIIKLDMSHYLAYKI